MSPTWNYSRSIGVSSARYSIRSIRGLLSFLLVPRDTHKPTPELYEADVHVRST